VNPDDSFYMLVRVGIFMPTTAVLKTLREIINGRRITLPPIQRQYAWKIGDIEINPESSQSTRLFKDLQQFAKRYDGDQGAEYFLGNLIVVIDPDSPLDSEGVAWKLLDGQQRLTSLTLLFKAFDYQLDDIDSPEARDLQGILARTWLTLNSNFVDEDHPFPIKHRRRSDCRNFSRFMTNQSQDLDLGTNMGQVATSYRRYVEEFVTVEQIKEFVDTVLDHVIMSVTITDNLEMGFQMFQTANARGLSLSAYDMFRAFVVKKIDSDFANQGGESETRRLHSWLKILEDKFHSTDWGGDDKKREGNLKDFMTAYMSIRSGQNLRGSTIVSNMESEIDRIESPDAMEEYLENMDEHLETWKRDIYPGRPRDRSSYRYQFLRRMSRMKMKQHQGAYLSFVTNLNTRQSDWMLRTVEWAIFKQLLKHGQLRGNTEIFASGFPADMHAVWNSEYSTQEAFLNFRNRWLEDKISGDLNQEHQCYDSGHNCIYALLHYLEDDQGLLNEDPGQSTHTTSLISLAPHSLAGINYDKIGNFFLAPGRINNGLNTIQTRNHNDSDDIASRLRTTLENVSSSAPHNSVTELQASDENSNYQRFIYRRSNAIYALLDELYRRYLNYDAPEL
jgi:hypothetical protein